LAPDLVAARAALWKMATMKHCVCLAIVLLACAATGAVAAQPRTGSAAAGAKTFRWVDDKGVTHYGDSIPPEYSQGRTAELNSQGVAVREYPAQLSPAEQVVVQERENMTAKRRQHDRFLLTTYVSVRDIEQLRDERLTQIEAQITASNSYVEAVDTRLASLKKRASNFKPYSTNPAARRMPDSLAAELVQTLNEGRSQRETLVAKRKEQQTLRDSFQADIDRYRELIASQRLR
jgi:hypothetical protein